jgi:hypothetical protein
MVETGCEPVNVQTDHQPALAAGGPQGWGLGACGNLGASGGPSRLHPTCRLGGSVLRFSQRAEDEVAVALTLEVLGQGDSLAESPDPIPASLPRANTRRIFTHAPRPSKSSRP